MKVSILIACLLASMPAAAQSVDKCARTEKGWRAGDLNAQYKWGLVLIKGLCEQPFDLNTGISLIKDAADKGDRDAIYKHAQLIYDFKIDDLSKVPNLIDKAAKLGQLDALSFYGNQKQELHKELDACFYYGLALKYNPLKENEQMPVVWKDTYSSYTRTFNKLKTTQKDTCLTHVSNWELKTDFPEIIPIVSVE